MTGCGTFESATGALTAGTSDNCDSVQTLGYGSTNLLTALNGWVSAQGTPANYRTWLQPSSDAGTYPGLRSIPVEQGVSIFSLKFYEPQLWDCQRSPAFPVEGRSFRISGLKAPYDQNLQKISFASSEDYVTFEYVSDLSALPETVQNRIMSSVKRYTNAEDSEIRAAAVVREVLHSGTDQATTTTLSTYGLVWALGEEGFLYTALDGTYKYSGGVGTFVSFNALKSGDSIIYVTEQYKPYTKDQLDGKNLAPEKGKKTAPDSVTCSTRNLFDTQRSAAFSQSGRIMNFFGLKAPYDNALNTVTLTSGQYIKFELISSVETAGKTDAFCNSVHRYSGATKAQVGEAAYVKEVLYGSDNVKVRDLGTGMIWAYEDQSFGFLFTALDGSYASSAGVGTLFTFKPVAYGSHLALKTGVVKPLPYDAAGGELDWVNYQPIVTPDNGQNIDETDDYGGIVLDEKGDPKSNVEVKIVIGDDTYTTTTDDKGRFIFNNLPDGDVGDLTIDNNDVGEVSLTGDDTKGFGNDSTERTDTGDDTNVFKYDGSTYQKMGKVTATVTNGANGTASQSTTSVSYGSSLGVYFTAKSGYTLSKVKVNNVENADALTAGGYVFSNITSAQTIESEFMLTYLLTVNLNGGSGSTTYGNHASGENVSINAGTKSGYTFSGWTTSNGGTYVSASSASTTFTMPAAATTITATWTSNGGDIGGGSTGSSTTKAEPVYVDGTEYDIGSQTVSGDKTTVTIDQTKLTEQIEKASDNVLVPINVTITNLAEGTVTTDKGTLVLNPMEFSVTATYGGKNVEVERFSQYVKRVIELPSGYDSGKITTAIRVEDGEHVPTEVYQKDGKYYAIVNSLTNSTYVLIFNEQTIADASGKWYEDTVNEMASRCIIFGRANGNFDGESNVTRAEFAAIIVRALGLPETGESDFSDVSAEDWFAGAVGAAAEYGIVNGYKDGSFKPNGNITRQEAMAMLQRAAKVAEFDGSTGDLSAFSDSDAVGAWAQEAVAFSVGSGLIVGKSDGTLAPLSKITRAETATVVLRLLQKAELVDVRSNA